MLYTTLARVREEIKARPDNVSDDDYVVRALREVTARIQRFTRLDFGPCIRTRLFDALGDHINDDRRLLHLDAPLLVASQIVTAAGVTLGGGDYTLVGHDPCVWDTPYEAIRLTAGYWSSVSANWQGAISVTGIWGYHTAYTSAWLDSGDAVTDAGGIDATTTTLTVADADGADPYGLTPRFSVGELLQIDTEWLEVIAVDTGTNTLTVLRGQRGSTAVPHDSGVPIAVWWVEPDIERAAVRWTAFMYSRRGVFEKTRFDGMATVEFPPDMPDEVANILSGYQAAYSPPFLVV